MKGDVPEIVDSSMADQFQFTPLCEGRHTQMGNNNSGDLFQFTPLYEGRLSFGSYVCQSRFISIHAPV